MHILFEGIDGSGKSTQCNHLMQWLVDKEEPVYHLKLPDYSAIGMEFTRIFNHPYADPIIRAKTLGLLATAQEVWSQQFTKDYKWLIQDRGFLSTLAYNSSSYEDERYWNRVTTVAKQPDLIVYLDLPVNVAVERIERRKQEVSVYEQAKFLVEVKHRYERFISQFPNVLTIDAARPAIEIHDRIIARIKN